MGHRVNILAYFEERYVPSRLNLSEAGALQMRIAIRQFSDLTTTAAIADLTDTTIVLYLRALLKKGLSPATVNTRRGYLLVLWTHAFKAGVNPHDPRLADVQRAVEPKRQPKAWSVGDVRVMLEQAEKTRRRGSCGWSAKEWQALILLVYYTGLRIGAVLHLRREHLRGHLLFVPAEIQKDREEMVFRLPEHLCRMLLSMPRPLLVRHGRNIGEYLLPWPWAFHDPQGKFTYHILRPAGLPISRHLKFHAIRRTVATLVDHHCGRDAAMRIMGHSSQKVTERYLADAHTVDPSLPGRLCPVDVLPILEVG